MRRTVALRGIAAALLLAGCHRQTGLPAVNSDEYRRFIRAFYIGLGGLQSGEDLRAGEYLQAATKIAPGEPAGWADLGLLQVRQQNLEGAFASVTTARKLVNENPTAVSQMETLLGVIESRRGNAASALLHDQAGASADPRNAKAVYALAQETERQGGADADANARKLLASLLEILPGNTAVIVDCARLSARLNDGPALGRYLAMLQSQSPGWPDRAKQQLAAAQTASHLNPHSAALPLQFLRNVLLAGAAYRRSQDAVKIPAAFAGEPFQRPLLLPVADFRPAEADVGLHFKAENVTPEAGVVWAGTIVLDDQAQPEPLWMDRRGIHFENATIALPADFTAQPSSQPSSQPGSQPGSQPSWHPVAAADFNYDFKTDIAVATSAGFRLFQQNSRREFVDITEQMHLPPGIRDGQYTGAWPFDVDLDGDLDIVLGSAAGKPTVLRNNGDGTFAVIAPFGDTHGLRDFVAADLNADGAPDVALLDNDGKLHVLMNERLGEYGARAVPAQLSGKITALAAADIDGNGSPDLIALKSNGAVIRLTDLDDGASWQTAGLLKVGSGTSELLLADFDNNGVMDLLIGSRLYLQSANGFSATGPDLPGMCEAAADLTGDGRVDAICVQNGAVLRALNRGTKKYGWQTVRLRAAKATGDQRINSFGIGGEVEIRAGLLTQKQSITSPLLHFGLGTQTETDLARIVWPNGSIQVEFSPKPGQTVLAEQRLKGSCPFLFAWNGREMRFVKDCAPWSPALGLHINAQQVASITQTQEWFKIPAGQFAPRQGRYDFRITAEYWETFYIDHYSFLSIDHPVGTEVFADERFAVPAPPLQLYFTGERKSFVSARDQDGRNISTLVSHTDGRYLDTFRLGRYQGVAQDHFVELALPEAAPRNGPLYLIGTGWMHPTDASINVALGQGQGDRPRGLSIEIQDAHGRWHPARTGLGFPAGRLKTVVLPLTGLFAPGAPRRFRLCTNLEIYWDQLSWAASPARDQRMTIRRLPLASANLGYRGFSRLSQAGESSPELPDYDHLAGAGQHWRDLEGYYTRFGDVTELLRSIDDRMVIANAGDELRLEVLAPPAAPSGTVRDLVLVGDGWIKDGDYNSTFSKTVLPLPFHGQKSYDLPPTTLENDPAYRAHAADWQWFHTRYVTPEPFVRALRR